MDADAEFDGSFRRDAGVALDEAGLHFDRAAHCVDHAAELDNATVASSLYHATMVDGYGWINQIAAQCAKPRQDTVFVRAGEPGVADYIRDKDRGEFPGFVHRASSPPLRLAQRCRENSPVQQTDGNPSSLPDWPLSVRFRSFAIPHWNDRSLAQSGRPLSCLRAASVPSGRHTRLNLTYRRCPPREFPRGGERSGVASTNVAWVGRVRTVGIRLADRDTPR